MNRDGSSQTYRRGWSAVHATEPPNESRTHQQGLLALGRVRNRCCSARPRRRTVPDQFTDMAEPSTLRHTEVDGRQAVVGQSHFPGVMWLDVELTAGHWVGMTGAGVDEAGMLAIGARLTIDNVGLPILADPTTFGLTLLAPVIDRKSLY